MFAMLPLKTKLKPQNSHQPSRLEALKNGKQVAVLFALTSMAYDRKEKIMLITLQQFMVIALVNLFVWMLTGILAMHFGIEEIVLVSILMTIFGIVGFVIALVKE